MKAITLLYHDIVENGKLDSSGFPGAISAKYKLEIDEFENHLRAIAAVIKVQPSSVLNLLEDAKMGTPLFLAFDDGGLSTYTHIAGMLEDYGWRGHFFIIANYIGKATFLSSDHIRELKNRGHIIGSHSFSHPTRMAHCSWQELIEEWRKSIEILSVILGEQVKVASVPGGYFSKMVAKAASNMGIEILFNSEPTARCYYVDKCLVLGRYSITRDVPPDVAAGFASSRLSPRFKQYLYWNIKKVAKFFVGELYLKVRKYYLSKKQVRQ